MLGLDDARPDSRAGALAALDRLVTRVGSARPTAVNLSWAVRRVRDAAANEPTPAAIRERALGEALGILDEDREACRRIARRHYENFPVGRYGVPADRRPDLHAIYAFARIADEGKSAAVHARVNRSLAERFCS